LPMPPVTRIFIYADSPNLEIGDPLRGIDGLISGPSFVRDRPVAPHLCRERISAGHHNP
jgi:hypothetical protein